VFRSGSPSEQLLADQTPAHILTDDKEHLANLIGMRGIRASPSCFVSSHVDQ
jgi:hypothetical protein